LTNRRHLTNHGHRPRPTDASRWQADGEMAGIPALRGELTDPAWLDANYVRRSDAELFWKGV
jgi:hypothetical protein